MKFYLCRGGDKYAPMIAEQSKWHYGTRNDYTAYETPKMVDLNWKNYDFEKYVQTLKRYRPELAFVADFEGDRVKMLDQFNAIKTLCDNVAICLKCDDIGAIPEQAIIGISVPTTYSGYIPPLETLKGRRIHLLGGSPLNQAVLGQRLKGIGATVESLDANYHIRKAWFGQFFERGTWKQARNETTVYQLAVMSGINIKQYITNALNFSQLRLL